MAKGKGPHPSTYEKALRVAELTRQKLSASVIAEIMGCSERTVVRHRKLAGVNVPRAKYLTDEELAAAKVLLEEGASIPEAARTIGRSHHGLRLRFPEYLWTPQQCAEMAALAKRMRRLEGKIR